MRSLVRNWRAAKARAYVRVVAVNRELSWLVSETLLPLLGVAAYVYIYRAIGAPEAYQGFVILGGAMTAYWLSVLWSMAMQFLWERFSGNLELYMISPASRMSILLGMAGGSMISTTIRALAIVLCGFWLFEVELEVRSWALLGLAFGLTLVALYGLGMMLTSLFFFFGRGAMNLSALLQEPVYLLSGFYFPVRSLGFVFAAAGSLLPLTLGLDAIRQLCFPAALHEGFLPLWVELGTVGAMGALFLVLSAMALRFMERKARQSGRLTLRWQ